MKKELSPRRQENELINLTIHAHDLTCNCNHPLTHIFDIGLRQGSTFGLPKHLLEEVKKCRLSGEEGQDGDAGGVDGLQDGELERLFATPEDDEG